MSTAADRVQAPQTRLRFFVAVNPGLEPLLATELTALGVKSKSLAGGVEVMGTFVDLMRICIQSRLAESVRVRLKTFEARHFSDLEDHLRRLPWHAYLRPDLPTHIAVTCQKSKLYHSNAVLERCQRAIEQALRTPILVTPRADAQQTVFLRLVNDQVEPSIDASGELLHRRGYRTHVGTAPLRETLAAALVRAATDNTNSTPTNMWDPFCGSGTIALEWLAAAQQYAPVERSFAFQQWPTFNPHASALVELVAAQTGYTAGARRAFGSDVSERALAAARVNAEQLGVTADTEWHHKDFAEVASAIPQGSVIITNPPYGKRVGIDREVLALHRRFENLLKQRRDLRPVVMACGCAPFLGAMTLPWKRLLSTKNGGLTVTFLRLD